MTIFDPTGPFQGRHSFISGYAVVDSDSGDVEVIEVETAPDPLDRTKSIFGDPPTSPIPGTLAALKADAVHGDSGTGKPANGAAANDAAFTAGQYVTIGASTKVSWSGTAWVAGAAPAPAPAPPPDPMPGPDPDPAPEDPQP